VCAAAAILRGRGRLFEQLILAAVEQQLGHRNARDWSLPEVPEPSAPVTRPLDRIVMTNSICPPCERSASDDGYGYVCPWPL
jgi:hypothetical protein